MCSGLHTLKTQVVAGTDRGSLHPVGMASAVPRGMRTLALLLSLAASNVSAAEVAPPASAVGIQLMVGYPLSPGLQLSGMHGRWRVDAAGGLVVMGLAGGFGWARAGYLVHRVDLRDERGAGSTFDVAILAGLYARKFYEWQVGPGLSLALSYNLYFGRHFAWTFEASGGGQLLFSDTSREVPSAEVMLAVGPKFVF